MVNYLISRCISQVDNAFLTSCAVSSRFVKSRNLAVSARVTWCGLVRADWTVASRLTLASIGCLVGQAGIAAAVPAWKHGRTIHVLSNQDSPK